MIQVAERLLSILRALNKAVAICVGILFLVSAGTVLLDIMLRRLGQSLGGTEEIAGYVMAIGTAWGMGFALLELSHVRIDFLRTLTKSKIRALFDVVAMFALCATVSTIALLSWPVLATTLANGSTANTPLETPLALVQIPWFAGWVWFAITSWLIFLAALILIFKGEFAKSEQVIGLFPEHEAQ